MFNSFSTALSALSADATALDVVGNNLANLNTPGFKASAAYFHDLMTQSMGMGETQVGFGTGRPITIRQFIQGAVQSSGGLLDAAIQGDGFFVLRDAQGAPLYTRAGGFQVDKNGLLLTPTGEHVQGWSKIDATGNADTSQTIGDIKIPVGTLKAPQATTKVSLDANLNAGAAADATSSFAKSIEVVDSLGSSHVLTFTFQKADANEWTFEITVPGEDVAGGTAGTPQTITPKNNTLKFDSSGTLTDPDADTPFSIDLKDLTDGAADMSVTWNLYDASGKPRLTQYSQPSAVSAQSQDGATAAQLARVLMSDDARVIAQYSNGQQIVVAQLALASVSNPESLIAVGDNAFQTSALSADPAVGLPGTGGRGTVVGGSLEASTVDIAAEFTKLIVLQRGYQANSRVVTTVDELSQDTINLKR